MKLLALRRIIREELTSVLEANDAKDRKRLLRRIAITLAGPEGDYDPKPDKKLISLAKKLKLKTNVESDTLVTHINARLNKVPTDDLYAIYRGLK